MAQTKQKTEEKLASYCSENGIKWLATYEANCVRRTLPGADLFLLVEFEEGRNIGREFFKIERELGDLLGAAIADLRALPELADYYRDEVLASATVKFASNNAAYLPEMLAEARETWTKIDAAERQAVKDKVNALPKEELADFCRSRGIRWLATSDIDIARRSFPGVDLFLLAEFEQSQTRGFSKHFELEDDFTALFGVVKASLQSRPGMRDDHRSWDRAVATAEVLFAG